MASAWQPTQPVFTLVIAWAIGRERLTLGKTLGILVSFGGAAFMACYGQTSLSADAVGNLLFAANCLGTALYVLTSKSVMQLTEPAPTAQGAGVDDGYNYYRPPEDDVAAVNPYDDTDECVYPPSTVTAWS